MQSPTAHPTPSERATGNEFTGGLSKHTLRAGTLVWGAVIVAAGILIILSTQLDMALDPGLTAMWMLLGAGALMVAAGAWKLLMKTRP
ncbi:hypothetical protein ACFUCV_05065 [Specibacter sp. NPDC057265]|uniref:hypothetical protein n=1 Tax=Specibacter sp. NPDC057265 TaxID=3346075 RepID=UPI00363F8BC3